MKSSFQFWAKFSKDSRGTIAVITAIVIFPLLFYCAGVPIDLARQVQLRSALQNIADGAALAGSAVIGEGATAYQACTLANSYVKAASTTGLAVPYSGLSPNGAFATTASYAVEGQAAVTLGCGTNAPNTTSLAEIEATTPNQVSVTISASMPTAFMSFVKKTLPVSVTATAVGPSNIITICVYPRYTSSIDYNALWFYGYIPATGILETVGVNGTTPAQFTEGSSDDPSLDSTKAEFLDDNTGALPTHPITVTPNPCGAGYYAVAIHLPVATRVGFELTTQRGGVNPCLYASTVNNLGAKAGYGPAGTPIPINSSLRVFPTCVQGDQPTAANRYSRAEGARSLVNFYTDAYGTSVFSTNRFYSTDYPATLNSSTTSTVSTADSSGDSRGDFSAAHQTLQTNTKYPGGAPLGPYDFRSTNSPANTGPNIVFFDSRVAVAQYDNPPVGLNAEYGVQLETADLVCEVSNGQLVNVPPSAVTLVNSVDPNNDFSNIMLGSGQQENLAVTNSTQNNVLQCPNETDGSPYNIDPTCKQLNGATLTAFWNDMGSPGFDNVNYGDLPYSIQCVAQSGVASLDFQNTALDQ